MLEKKNIDFGISFLIPLVSKTIPKHTIYSILSQRQTILFEIIILVNGVFSLEKEIEEVKDICPCVRLFQIKQIGKGNALNVGLERACYELVCILDADCILDKNAIGIALQHFSKDCVCGVGGRLRVLNANKNILTFCQSVEYMKAFNISRRLFQHFDSTILISGAFGLFRKSDLIRLNGYDTKSVGEDMELVLRVHDLLHKRIVYESQSICYTSVPYSFIRLLKQRDRWQRGLFDCLMKYRHMILNRNYGFLGLVVLPYQVLVELLGPLFIVLFPLVKPKAWLFYFLYFVLETVLVLIAEYVEDRKLYVFITKLPKAIFVTLLLTLLSFPLALARLWGMISFHYRKMKW